MTPATDAASLFAQYSDRLVRYLTGVSGEREAARDLTQEVFLRVSRTPIPVATQDQLAGWLFKIARNVAVDHHRQRRRRPEADIDSVPEATRDAQQEMALALKQALATLPDLDRDVFLLREVSGTHDGSMKKVRSAWTIQATPIRQTGEAVTVRVQWTRSRDNGRPSTVGGDTQLTLRPGQWLALDVMPQADEAAAACLSMSLGVGIVHWPEPDRDRRLLAVDLWLVERLPDGKERSQPLALRGLYNQAHPLQLRDAQRGHEDARRVRRSADLAGRCDGYQDHHAEPGDRLDAVAASAAARVPGGRALASFVRRLDERDSADRCG